MFLGVIFRGTRTGLGHSLVKYVIGYLLTYYYTIIFDNPTIKVKVI